MDFFASSYSSGTHTPTRARINRSGSEHTAQGYGSETNAHLRRASSGLEIDIISPKDLRETFSFEKVHKNYDNDDLHSKGKVPEDISLPQSESPKGTSPIGSPSYQRRTAVSNPCLLHHTNTSGGGTVQSPIMPRSFSFSHGDGKPVHEKTIPEGRELGL
ncbi:hypothetical protein BGZ76_010515 [Entomortierella beljakovae]|nr:hypothetical protein BGZ76_010515 [Entomortierella beljakovae]